MRRHPAATIALILMALAAALVGLSVPGETQSCEGLKPAAGKLGYAPRGNRCEGMYESTISTEPVLVSYTRGPIRYRLDDVETITISVPDLSLLAATAVTVRAVARAPRTYYRMDASTPANAPVTWPVRDVLKPQQLGQEQVGVFGWVGQGGQRIFVPLKVVGQGLRVAKAQLEMVVRPSEGEVDRIVWRWWPEGPSPATTPAWQKVARDRIDPRPTTIVIPHGPAAIIRVEVKMKMANSPEWGSLTLRAFRPANES